MTTESVDAVDVAARCLARLAAEGRTLAAAESLTAGMLTATLAAVPGASSVLRGGLVAYANDVKAGALGIPDSVVSTYGAVSAECATAMAARIRELLAADVGLSTTGVAGPDTQEGQPVGRVYVAVAGPDGVHVEELSLSGSREEIRAGSVKAVLALLETTLG